MNNRELAHVWVQQRRESGKGSSFFFEGDTIFSYGRHFPIARFQTDGDGQRYVLFTWRGYSRTTSRHISLTRQALHGLDHPIYYVENPANDPGLKDAEYHRQEALNYYLKAQTARENKEGYLNMARGSEKCFFQMCQVFLIKHPDAKKKSLFDPKLIEKMSADAKAQRAEITRRRKEREAERIKDRETKRQEWLSGERNYMPYEYGDKVFLRIKGDKVETSRGASVPLEEAKTMYLMAAQLGVEMVVSKQPKIGEYQITDFKDGNIIAGCHTIPFAEIERIFA